MVTDRKKQTPTYTIKGPKFNGALSLQGAEEPLMAHPPSTGSKFSWNFLVNQSIAVILSSVLLLSVVILGLITRLITYIPRAFSRPPRPRPSWDNPHRWCKEKLTKDPKYYARNCGFDIVEEQVETKDGYFLRMHRIVPLYPDHKLSQIGQGYPILIMHGLFQSSGSFITSEDRSIAFWFAQRGFQVYLGNNRAVFDMGHRHFNRYDPKFWDFDVNDLAMYDFPAMVNYICEQTGYKKIAYIGHSQGNAIAFIALSKWGVPELGEKLSYFCALAPAVFIGPLGRRFPLKYLSKLDWAWWQRVFGVLDFTPLMKFSYDWTPATPYAALGYQMFAYLFEWNDTHWLQRRKPKMFRFTPQPVSSKTMFWWAGMNGFSTRGHIFDPMMTWFDKRCPPISLYGGGSDHLVLPVPVIEHFKNHEPDVRLVREKLEPAAEHCDHYWAADAVEWCFNDILEDIQRTRE
ncbi:Similar to S.cerevisiae protein YEH2 (Steryl ester hydrolase) [Malassezia sympodialis ATCC 42132]|uniref:Similar to S.cerevisiae protein YEH2 (Steryl ester hydrolase) n=1 Tax=Malassezia sympodialis (strain ATCC 42132) TaxID=1230383 RepID=A0A1M8A059_MALS4|nr:Similar to S.cerevisiae protein YEH2 (Steryl ester hydrolase) [Malassezia sympodialis ATCC 42132]